jgi:hypothetical protein
MLSLHLPLRRFGHQPFPFSLGKSFLAFRSVDVPKGAPAVVTKTKGRRDSGSYNLDYRWVRHTTTTLAVNSPFITHCISQTISKNMSFALFLFYFAFSHSITTLYSLTKNSFFLRSQRHFLRRDKCGQRGDHFGLEAAGWSSRWATPHSTVHTLLRPSH